VGHCNTCLYDREEQQYPLGCYVDEEAIVILYADAIVNPRAMVVEALHALVANAAVATANSPNRFAVRT